MADRESRAEVSVRPIDPEEFDSGARVLAESFAEEAFFSYLLGSNTASRSRLLVHLMKGMIRGHEPCSTIDGAYVDNRLVGLAIAVRPERFPLKARDMLRIAMHTVPACLALALSRPGILRLFRAVGMMEKHQPQDEACWYLAFFGVAPGHRRFGAARRLVEVVLDRADARQVGCYLETAGERTMRMCRLVGFEVRHKLTPFPDGPTFRGMWRSPREARR